MTNVLTVMACSPPIRELASAPRVNDDAWGVRQSSRRTDSTVLEAFRHREPAAVRLVYREYGRLVYTVALHVLGQRELAEEATQQTFVRAWQAADRVDVDRDPAPWLSTIAKRVAIDIHRREARRPAEPSIDVTTTADRVHPLMTQAPPDVESLDAVWRVRKAIDELPLDEAAVVRLQHLEGMTHTEIAEQLGIPLGTVKSRSHRAHQRLCGLLGNLRRQSQ